MHKRDPNKSLAPDPAGSVYILGWVAYLVDCGEKGGFVNPHYWDLNRPITAARRFVVWTVLFVSGLAFLFA